MLTSCSEINATWYGMQKVVFVYIDRYLRTDMFSDATYPHLCVPRRSKFVQENMWKGRGIFISNHVFTFVYDA